MRTVRVHVTTYTQEITSDEYDALTSYDDDHQTPSEETLIELIDGVEGVFGCDYSGHFGLVIYYNVERIHDNPATHKKVCKIIDDKAGKA